jgi:GntR family transcriptional regulator
LSQADPKTEPRQNPHDGPPGVSRSGSGEMFTPRVSGPGSGEAFTPRASGPGSGEIFTPGTALDNGLPTFSPLYRQIKARLLLALGEGEWKAGGMIPSEGELARRFMVSQGTVRKAVEELATEHVLVRHQGRGTFVATHHEERAQFRFLRLRKDGGGLPATESRVIECRRCRPPAEVARELRLRATESVIFIRRLLSVDRAAMVLDEIWLPGGLFRGLNSEGLQAHHGPLYALFERNFGVRMLRAHERLKAIACPAEQAKWLGLAEATAVLLVDRLSTTYNDQPVEVRKGYYLTREHYYANELL